MLHSTYLRPQRAEVRRRDHPLYGHITLDISSWPMWQYTYLGPVAMYYSHSLLFLCVSSVSSASAAARASLSSAGSSSLQAPSETASRVLPTVSKYLPSLSVLGIVKAFRLWEMVALVAACLALQLYRLRQRRSTAGRNPSHGLYTKQGDDVHHSVAKGTRRSYPVCQ